MKHAPATPLPWETSANGKGQFDVCAAGAGDMVADLAGMPETGEQDANYIVHACNEFPKLAARVKELETALGQCADSMEDALARGPYWRENFAMADLPQARAALNRKE